MVWIKSTSMVAGAVVLEMMPQNEHSLIKDTNGDDVERLTEIGVAATHEIPQGH
jgi:hypothetical protein